MSFPEFIFCGHPIVNVNSCKYLGHWLSTVDDDNTDIENHVRLLFARTCANDSGCVKLFLAMGDGL